MLQQLHEYHEQIEQSEIALESFKHLEIREEVAIQRRLQVISTFDRSNQIHFANIMKKSILYFFQSLTEDVLRQTERERELQKEYEGALNELQTMDSEDPTLIK